jgi:hypothetical protein
MICFFFKEEVEKQNEVDEEAKRPASRPIVLQLSYVVL